MSGLRRLGVLALLMALMAGLLAPQAGAVEPGEMLADPALEARAREIGKEVRCLVCRSESVEASNADFARDLRLVIRERIEAGDSDAQVRSFLVDRFGEYVLLRPRFGGATLVLWLLGPALLILGGAMAVGYFKRMRRVSEVPLSATEEARLKALLGEEPASDS